MPVAEDLLSVRFDTPMLAKLALSVAGVLLVSWAYRFYNSRRWHIRRDGPGSQRPNRTAARWEPDTGTSSEGSADGCEEELLRLDEHSNRETLLAQCQHSPGEPQNIPSPAETLLAQCQHSPRKPQYIPSPGKTLLVQHMQSPREPQNIPSPGETLLVQHMQSPREPQNIPSPGETLLTQCQHSPREPQNILSPGETLLVQHMQSPRKPPNIPSPEETLLLQHMHSPREPQNIPSPGETLLAQCQHSPEEPQNIPSPIERLLVQNMHSPGEPQNIPSPGETLLVQHMHLPGEPQNMPSLGETFSDHHENSPGEPQNIPSLGETFSEKNKYSSAEAQRAYLDAVEPDVAIVRGDENLNYDPSPPTVESMVQHDPPGIKPTPLTHDHSTQKASHPNCQKAEGRLDADLLLDFSPSPPSVENLDQSGTSQSPCQLGRLKLSTSMGRELRQDLSHLGNSSHSLSKKEVRMEGRDFLLERDGDAPAEAHGKIYDSHMESSLQLVSDESPSISNPIGELYEAAVSHDPGGLKEPEVSCDDGGTEAIRPLSPYFTPPLIPQDLVLPSTASFDPPPPGRQGLVRKDSYMHIVENADLQIPCLNRKASTPMSTISSLNPSSEDLSSKPPSPVKDPTIFSRDISGATGLEGIEKLSILQILTEGSSSELERLQGRLDLGNCLHALSLARKQGHASLQRAALKVMSDNYLQVLQDPKLYGSLRGGDRDLIQTLRTRGKRCLVVADLDPQDWAGSESSLPKTSSSLYYYDDCKDSWHFLCPLPKEVVSRGSAMCVMDNYLFVTLGCQGLGRDVQPSRRAFCYNPTTSIWKELSPMNEARPQCKLVALGGCVYAIGGECLSSVERYNPRTGRWAFVAPMPNDTFAVAHRATACNGELFVSGGTLRYTLLRYNPATNAWRRSLIVGSKERTVEMVAVRNFLYRFDVGSTFGVSVYRYHVAARLWYECCSRRLSHCSAFQCAVMDDIIYCVSRRGTMRFLADQVSPAFITEDLSILSAAKGILLPLILVLPETEALQTRV